MRSDAVFWQILLDLTGKVPSAWCAIHEWYKPCPCVALESFCARPSTFAWRASFIQLYSQPTHNTCYRCFSADSEWYWRGAVLWVISIFIHKGICWLFWLKTLSPKFFCIPAWPIILFSPGKFSWSGCWKLFSTVGSYMEHDSTITVAQDKNARQMLNQAS